MRLEKGVAGNGAVLHELASEAAWIRFLRDRCVATHVGNQHCDDQPLGVSDTAPASAQPVRDSARQQAAEHLALLLAIDDGLMQPAQVPKACIATPGRLLRQLEEELLD